MKCNIHSQNGKKELLPHQKDATLDTTKQLNAIAIQCNHKLGASSRNAITKMEPINSPNDRKGAK